MNGVSLVVTVRNEEAGIGSFIESVLGQTRMPSEMIVVDGGSTDGTARVIARYMGDERVGFPLRFLRVWGANISRGRNVGVAAARHDIVAVSDAGCTLERSWLEEITAPFGDGECSLVAGNYVVETEGYWESAAAAMTIPDPGRIACHLPSSRSVAFRRSTWESVGGYPEQLDWAEDTAFSIALKSRGHVARFARNALVRWRPRGTPLALFRQYFRYASGDGMAGHFPGHYALRASALLLFAAVTSLAVAKGGARMLPVPAGLLAAYWLYFVGKAPHGLRSKRHLLLSLPVLLICDAGRVLGYAYGLVSGLARGRGR